MSHHIRYKGSHTWDLFLHYYRCPQCGLVVEDRQSYHSHAGVEEKFLDCPRCHKQFVVARHTVSGSVDTSEGM